MRRLAEPALPVREVREKIASNWAEVESKLPAGGRAFEQRDG